MELIDLIYIIIAILIAVVVFHIFWALLPIFVVIVLAYFIYKYLSERN